MDGRFLVDGSAYSREMLRAVITLDHPTSESSAPITTVEVSADEAHSTWVLGFSLLHNTPREFDDRLKLLRELNQPKTKVTTGPERQKFCIN